MKTTAITFKYDVPCKNAFSNLHIPRDGGSQSGLFCAVASLMEKLKVEREVSVVNAARRVKARRPNAIHCQVHCNGIRVILLDVSFES